VYYGLSDAPKPFTCRDIACIKVELDFICKGNISILRRILHLDLAKGNPKRML
jgi:hypothetical protein